MVSYPLVTAHYDDSIQELEQAFNYRNCGTVNYQAIRLIVALPLLYTCLQGYYFIKELLMFGWLVIFPIIFMYLSLVAVILTILSVSKMLDSQQRNAQLLRKWTHSLNSIILFFLFWQTFIYAFTLHTYLQSQRLDAKRNFFIALYQRVLLLPQLSLLVNFAITDMILCWKQSKLVLKMITIYQFYMYTRKFESVKQLFSTNLVLDIVGFVLIIGVFAVMQQLMCWLSQFYRGRKIQNRAPEQKGEPEGKKKKKK